MFSLPSASRSGTWPGLGVNQTFCAVWTQMDCRSPTHIANSNCTKDEYHIQNNLWLFNPDNHYCDKMAQDVLQSCAIVLHSLDVSHRPTLRTQLLPYLAIFNSEYWSILNTHLFLPVCPVESANDRAESESTVQCSKAVWKNLAVLRCAGSVDRSLWKVCTWVADRFTLYGSWEWDVECNWLHIVKQAGSVKWSAIRTVLGNM